MVQELIVRGENQVYEKPESRLAPFSTIYMWRLGLWGEEGRITTQAARERKGPGDKGRTLPLHV